MNPDRPVALRPPIEALRATCAAACRRPIDSATLLGARDEVEIVHSGEAYRLRRTRQGKLILTK